MEELLRMTALELGSIIRDGKVGVKEAVQCCQKQIQKREPQIGAFLLTDKEKTERRVKEVEEGIRQGRYTGPLAGVPVAVKDNICTRGMKTTCASRMLENFVPTYTAEAVKNLEQAGVVVIGKTNMDEFAMGSTTETSYFGPTRNPWAPEHVPGGSSGGSCAAVAAEECSFALGSDTGGSIRQPSSFCGVTGLKPTYGTVSRYGLIAYGSSLDQIGPVGKDAADCAAVLEAIASHDPKDSTSMKRDSYDFLSALDEGVRGLRIGIPRDYFGDGLDEEVKSHILEAAKVLEGHKDAVARVVLADGIEAGSAEGYTKEWDIGGKVTLTVKKS